MNGKMTNFRKCQKFRKTLIWKWLEIEDNLARNVFRLDKSTRQIVKCLSDSQNMVNHNKSITMGFRCFYAQAQIVKQKEQ